MLFPSNLRLAQSLHALFLAFTCEWSSQMANGMAYIVVDLGFGDAGKGTIVEALVRKTYAKLVVRFNGGSQAAHNVVFPDGTRHTFSQFGSATFVPWCEDIPLRALSLESHFHDRRGRGPGSQGGDRRSRPALRRRARFGGDALASGVQQTP